MKKHLYIVLFPFLLAGCFSPVKQGWNNFTAYYNTFYNAKQSFDEGVKLNLAQQPEVDISRPIRIHPSPTGAGHDEFEIAIEKGASILRNHSESSYVPDAVSLIGQSYFYRQEYFSALEKFQELAQITSGKDLQEAIIWQGRTYLEMDLYEEGIRVLNAELEFVEEWASGNLAQVYALIAQLHVGLENWDEASVALHISAGDLEQNRHQARAYLLHGQVQEKLGNDYQALAAYRLSAGILTEYDVEFNARRKLAEMHRKTGDYQAALSQYRALERDDKFLEFHPDLRYEIAKTYHEMGEVQYAVTLYNNVLHNRFELPSNRVRARTYFGLAEIYRNRLNNFQMAAAYYDSANSLRSNLPDPDESENVDEVARAFGEYASIKQEISHIDSLLHLASLSPEELDSLLKRMQQDFETEMDQRDSQIIVRAEDLATPEEAAESVEFGFLNINDPVRLEQATLRFRAIWGDRPLVDNWRRQSSIMVSAIEGLPGDDVTDGVTSDSRSAVQNGSAAVPGVDISEIPFTEPERLRVEQEREQLNYRLGNLFFLSLSMPDSARYYFNEVIESALNENLRARVIYSMAELELEYGDRNAVDHYSESLFELYPDSPFANRLATRLGLDRPYNRSVNASDSVLERYYAVHGQIPDTSFVEKGHALRELAEEAQDPDQKAIFLLEAAENYIQAARSDTLETDSREHIVTARELLTEISEIAQGSQQALRAERLLEILDEMVPEPENQPFVLEHFPPDRYPSDPAGDLPFCSEAGAYLDLPGGAARVIDELNWSEEVRNELPREIFYRFAVLPDGTIESFSLLEPELTETIEEGLNVAIGRLSFEPIGGEHSIRCRIRFPVRQ